MPTTSGTPKTLLQIDFPFAGPGGDKMAAALPPLAEDIATEPGFLWKVWTENREAGEADGIYVFDSEAALDRYLEKHLAHLQSFGITQYTAKRFAINAALTKITRGTGPAA